MESHSRPTNPSFDSKHVQTWSNPQNIPKKQDFYPPKQCSKLKQIPMLNTFFHKSCTIYAIGQGV